jgi:FtsP/CotA-like multicopper oxidase with cupredoxin domain
MLTMISFNLQTWNSPVFAGIDHLIYRRGFRESVSMGNLTMTNHLIHVHDLTFEAMVTDGGWIGPEER